jgi:hypothetical protein
MTPRKKGMFCRPQTFLACDLGSNVCTSTCCFQWQLGEQEGVPQGLGRQAQMPERQALQTLQHKQTCWQHQDLRVFFAAGKMPVMMLAQ